MQQTDTMNHRATYGPRAAASAAGRAVTLAAVVAGVPVMLWRTVGWPLPGRLSVTAVRDAWTMGDLPADTVIKALACAVWIVWALVMASVAVHLLARFRRVVVTRPRFIPHAVFAVTGRWMSGITLVASTTVLSMGPSLRAPARPLSSVTATLGATAARPAAARGAGSAGAVGRIAPPTPSATGRTHVVHEGETLWEIAEATLGDGSRWNDILELNRDVLASTDLLPVGTRLAIPSDSSSILGTVTVERGDHFWKLSDEILTEAYGRTPTRRELDDYWRDMVELNRADVPSHNVNLIHPGEQYEAQLPDLPPGLGHLHLVSRLDHPVPERQEPPTPIVHNDTPAVVRDAPVVAAPVAPSPAAPVVSARFAVQHDDDRGGNAALIRTLAAVGMSAVGAGAVLIGLRRRRALAARRRSTGERFVEPTEDVIALLARLRAVAEPSVTVTVDAVQRLLRRQLAETGAEVPSVLVMRAGRNGVELLLDQPLTTPPPGFIAVDDGHCWVLSPQVTEDDLTTARRSGAGVMPALVSVGSNNVGTVLVDLERLGALEIRSDDLHITGLEVLTAMAAEWEGAPWLDREESRIIGIGLPSEPFAAFERVELVSDADTERMVAGLVDRARNDAALFPEGKHRARVASEGLLYGPTIVLVGPGYDDAAVALAQAAMLRGSGLAVVATCTLPHGASQLVITGDAGVLEPFGLDLERVVHVDTVAVETMGALLDASDDVEAGDPWPAGWGLDEHDSFGSEEPPGVEESDTERARAVVDEIAQPTGQVTLRMLSSPMPSLDGMAQELSARKTPRCVELVTFLAMRGPQSPARLMDALWPDKTDQRTAISAMSRIRSAISPANVFLADDRYGLTGVDCDWVHFGRLVDASTGFDGGGAMVVLRAALEMVTCRPFEGRQVYDGRSSTWEWLDHGWLEADVQVRIVDAAESYAELALQAGDAVAALWGCGKARLIDPHREATHLLRMRAYALLGDRDALHREVKHAFESAALDDPLAERSANVMSLLRVLDRQFCVRDDEGAEVGASAGVVAGVGE